MKKIMLYGAAVVAAALALPAFSQEVGVYTGTSADGQALSFTVTTDPNNGALEVTSAGVAFSAPCANSTYVLNTSWGIGLSSDINNGRVVILDSINYFTFNIFLDFSRDGQSATGTITTFSPTLLQVGPSPYRALFCSSPKQTLTLSLQPASSDVTHAALALAPGAAINLSTQK